MLVFSIIARLLLMGRRLESWPFWLLVNTISVPPYFNRGLRLTALLYAAYWLNAVVSWYFWRRQMAAQAVADAANPAANPAAEAPRQAAGL
ncbi:nicotinamide mononucleotide transporter [Rugamonas sp. DEMB1]|uniref:nicotinamide mononucleotide transporter n=1 Tax=Rugamonas sp. DEMB1 TaxID=3039386 RepID=UPI0028BF51C8|nr:nicotinamide mononucleotide transporter [Rugamonas sp. DEMB1]